MSPDPEPTGIELANLLAIFKRYLDLDPGAIRTVLATVVANRLPGEPVWLFVVGPSSSGKTEVIRCVERVPDVYPISKLTEAALLSGTSRGNRAEDATGGVLREIGTQGILLVRDFSTVLSMNADGRAALFAAFRDLYDGYYSRHLGVDGGRVEKWAGKIGMIAAVTQAIDTHHEAVSSLGERWVYYRPPACDAEAQARRALATVGRMQPIRAEFQIATAAFLDGIDTAAAVPNAPDVDDFLADLATFAVRCRSPVERDPRTRGIVSVPEPEGPARLVHVLAQLHRGFTLIGNDGADTRHLLTKIALDSMPATRQKVVRHLASSKCPTETKTAALAVGVSEQATRRVLEELAAHDVVARSGDDRAHRWELSSWARTKWNAIHQKTE
jgi:hypothetical protein